METKNNSTNSTEYIDLIELWNKIWKQKKLFFIVWGITFVVACAIILPVPRLYQSTIQLAPEASNATNLGSLGSLASSFGINLNTSSSQDALFPDLYPDILSTNEFVVALFDVPVRSMDGEIETTYGDYMLRRQKVTYFKWPKILLGRLKFLIAPPPARPSSGDGKINPQYLSREMDVLVQKINEQISCSVDKKTGVISITVLDQDPLIAAEMADTICVRLQQVITDYRTQKARIDEQYYRHLMEEAVEYYHAAQNDYVQFCEANWKINMPSISAQKDNLSNICNLRLSALNAIINQHQMACAKIQENTPAFTTLSRPCVPIKACKPKRMIFVVFMCFMATIVLLIKICRTEIKAFLNSI